MRSARESLHFIGCFGSFNDKNFVKERDAITLKSPGALPDMIEGADLLGEIEKNRGFMAGVVVLTDYKHQLDAVRAVNGAKEMGVKNVKVVCCA